MIRILILLLLVPFLCGAQVIVDSLNFQLKHNLIFIKVNINDTQEPLNFLWDTGAGISVIDNSVAQRLDLPKTDTIRIGTSGKTIAAGLTEQAVLKLGRTTILENVELAWMDLEHLSQYLNVPVDGVIGSELLQNFVVETDVSEMKFRLYPHDSYQYSGEGHRQPIIGLESGHIGLNAEVTFGKGQAPANLVLKIDTGAPNSITLHHESVQKNDLVSDKNLKSVQGFGADSTITNNLRYKAKEVQIGSKKWKRVPLVLEVDPINTNQERLGDGLIGQGLLLDFNIIYDLKGGYVYLEASE